MAFVTHRPPFAFPNYGLLGIRADQEDSGYSLITLESVTSDVLIRGFVAQVSAKLIYCNTTQHVVQVRAALPVDEAAAVYHCEAKLGGRTIVTHCMEKKKAEKEFDKAVSEGKTAVMTREHDLTTDILTLDLGNLPAGGKAEITLKLIMELRVKTDGGVSFVLPTLLNPRYYPQDHQARAAESIDWTCNEARIVFAPQPYAIEVKATVRGSHTIARVTSHTDDLTVTLEDDDMTAQVRQDSGFQSDHDWSMLIYYNNPYKPHILRETADRSGTGIMKDDLLMLNFFPEVPSSSYSSRNEFIFIIDRSGSMQGTKIQSARATLLLFLKSLPAGCLFNVVSFGSTFSLLFKNGSETYTEKTLDNACNLCATMDANMGGTEILQPLQHIYSKEPSPQYPRQILLITDGQVFNVDQVTQLVGRHSHETRVFCVGIGDGASTALVHGAALAGRGWSEMVRDETNLQQKVMDLMASMVQENVSEVNISCEVEPACRVRLVPKVPPVIFGGQHVILYARVPPTTQVKSVSLRGKVGSQALQETLDGQHFTVVHDESKSLHRLAARAQIRQWQLDEEEDVAEDMVALSVASGVVCRRTALVGIDQESGMVIHKPTSEQPQLINLSMNPFQAMYSPMCAASPPQPACAFPVFKSSYSFIPSPPAMNDRSMKGLLSMRPCSAFSHPASVTENYVEYCSADDDSMMESVSPDPMTMSGDLQCSLQDRQRYTTISQSGIIFGSTAQMQNITETQTNKNQLPLSGLMEVVRTQKFDGSWKLEDAAKFSGVAHDVLSASNPAKEEAAWATALVLVVLERKFDAEKDQWRLLSIKARNFITGCGEQVDDLLAKARLAVTV